MPRSKQTNKVIIVVVIIIIIIIIISYVFLNIINQFMLVMKKKCVF
jgi:hypothetical protein